MNDLVKKTDHDLFQVLESSLYPGATPLAINMVIGYCQAAGLDPIHKPVHIVPMWDSKRGSMRDVIMPGIGLYRTLAARTGQYAGISEPEFGPNVIRKIGGVEMTFPEWCVVTVTRRLQDGYLAKFTSKELWLENYAEKGGKERDKSPNAMWAKRPYAQLAKCTESQALRKAFPEIGSQPTAEEMEGKSIEMDVTPQSQIVEKIMHGAKERLIKTAAGFKESSEIKAPEFSIAEVMRLFDGADSLEELFALGEKHMPPRNHPDRKVCAVAYKKAESRLNKACMDQSTGEIIDSSVVEDFFNGIDAEK